MSRLLREQKHFRMHEELGTEPGFYYLHGQADAAGRAGGCRRPPSSRRTPGKIRTRGVEPCAPEALGLEGGRQLHVRRRRHRPVRVRGGRDARRRDRVAGAGLPALALVALGLFCVLLKIGRPLRSIYVLRQPQRSWMAREAWVAMAFFPLAALALWFAAAPGRCSSRRRLGLVFLFCQGMILFGAKGIPAWRAPLIVPLIVATGLAEGGGLLLAALAVWPSLAADRRPRSRSRVVLLAVAARAGPGAAYVAMLATQGRAHPHARRACGRSHLVLSLGLALPAASDPGRLHRRRSIRRCCSRSPGSSAFAAGWRFKFIW